MSPRGSFFLLGFLVAACSVVRAGYPPHRWSKSFGDALEQRSECVATDPWGNVLLTGEFYGTMDFGGGPLQSSGDLDIYLAKFSANGTHFWSLRFGDSEGQYAFAVATDGEGNILLTGYFRGVLDFGGGPLVCNDGEADIFLVKLDPNGRHLWSKQFGEEGFQYGESVAADPEGNVILLGNFMGTVDFGGGPFHNGDPSCLDIFLAKFDASGNHLWSHSFGDDRQQFGRDVAVDGQGNVVITGYFSGTVDFGGGAMTCAGFSDLLAAKFDRQGRHLWSHAYGDSRLQEGWGVAVDPWGNVLLTGLFMGTIDFGGGPLHAVGDLYTDVFLAKLGPAGTHVWSKRFGDWQYEWGKSVAADAAGNVILTGFFYGTISFGDDVWVTEGGDDIFLARFAPDGASLWSARYGDENQQAGESVATDPWGNIALTGEFQGEVDFGGGALVNPHGEIPDVYLASLGSSAAALECQPEGSPFSLAASPNPLGRRSSITFSVAQAGPARLDIVDASGRMVRKLFDERVDPGRHCVIWNGRADAGNLVAPGVYILRLATPGALRTEKLIRLDW